MQPKAILFGAIGTLAETSELQRRAFNIAFSEAGLDWKWDAALYRELLAVPGGIARILAYAEDRGLVVDAEDLHRRKTALFQDLLKAGPVRMRAGVLSVLSAASAAAVPLGVASTTERETVDAVLSAAGGLFSPQLFAFVGDRSQVHAPKPSPEIYQLALKQLRLEPSEVLAIEDTPSSLAAPLALGIRCIAFPGAYASGPFDGADRIVSELSPDTVGLGCELRDFAIAS